MTGIPTPKELAGDVNQLDSFPDVAFRINDLLADDNSSADDLGDLIASDPALSTALLRVANSALYGMRGSVSSVARAVTVVGSRQVRDLAFGISANASFKGIPNELISVEDFWRHSLSCAVATESIGKACKIRSRDSLFTAGLLHDIGHLVMYNHEPQLSRESLLLSLEENDGLSPYLSEREVFSYDHMDVGAELARQWHLPQFLIDCIQFHHRPYDYEGDSQAVCIVHLANSIAVLAELDSNNLEEAPPIDERVLADLGFSLDWIADIVTETKESADELLSVFIGG